MRASTRAAIVVAGSVLALGAAPAEAASGKGGGGKGAVVQVKNYTTPKKCVTSFSPYIKKNVQECREGWGQTKKIKRPGWLIVREAHQVTLTITAPGYFFKDVHDVRKDFVYKNGKLVKSSEFDGVTYTIAGKDCVIATKKTFNHGVTKVKSVNTCGSTGAPGA